MTAAQDSRAQFEAWFRKEFRSELYCSTQWMAWQASRAALSAEPVELDIEGLMELVDAYGEACDAVARTGAGVRTVTQTRDSIRVLIGSMIARAKLQAKLEIAAARQPVDVPKTAVHTLESEYASCLARCRDAFPPPEPNTKLETLWIPAMGCALSVPDYIEAIAAAPQPAAQERKPFSDEERLRIFEKHFSHDMRQGEFFDEIFIIAEREHGIRGEKK